MLSWTQSGKLGGRLSINEWKQTFGFEGKVAVLANVWTDVGVRSNVLFQHAWFFTANATFSTYVLAPAATSHVHILFIGLVPGKERERY